MTVSRSRALAALLAVLTLVLGAYGALTLASESSYAQAAPARTATGAVDDTDRPEETRTRTVEVAENGTRFVFDEAPLIEGGDLDGFPAYGNAFVTEGYLYPEGTLDGSDGVNPDGSPEFPEEVIGQWLCRGYFIGKGAATTEGAWVYTTQLFAFGDDPDAGRETLIVTGYEGAEVGEEVIGAVTGGTGKYATARGEAVQELLGFNNAELPTMGIDKRVTFEITAE